MKETKLELLQGTPDVMVVQTLVTLGSQHGESRGGLSRQAAARCC
ncbi:MAG TPA: hypothetical protein VKV15_16760 [Bryobacteraceae bacterium]|nr:hypothetical protein [Bryobacteraceae bacterium]